MAELSWLVDSPGSNPDNPDSKANGVATLVLAHGAGAPMDSDFMNELTGTLVACGITVVRFEFPYMAARRNGGGRGFPDRPAVLLDCWQHTVCRVQRRSDLPRPLLIGGKSLGGRMATRVADSSGVDGVCCFGYPFFARRRSEDAGGRGDVQRIGHLTELRTPTQIFQGTRDPFGQPEAVSSLLLSGQIELVWLESGDHDLLPTRKSGLQRSDLLATAAGRVRDFAGRLACAAGKY